MTEAVRRDAGPAVPAMPDPAARWPAMRIRWLTGDGEMWPGEAALACRRRALLLWPRLDRSRLARTKGDPWRIARLVAARTPRSIDEIVAMLTVAAPACPLAPATAPGERRVARSR